MNIWTMVVIVSSFFYSFSVFGDGSLILDMCAYDQICQSTIHHTHTQKTRNTSNYRVCVQSKHLSQWKPSILYYNRNRIRTIHAHHDNWTKKIRWPFTITFCAFFCLRRFCITLLEWPSKDAVYAQNEQNDVISN